jgi:lysophospholipid acyltransferase (LPLAT)-like uncharacterized protein
MTDWSDVVDPMTAGDDDGAPPEAKVRLDWGSRAIIAGAPPILWAMAATWRLRRLVPDPARFPPLPAGAGRIYAFWHGQMLPVIALHRREAVAVLISTHRDGERLARVAKRFGFGSIRGSTTRGGATALRAMHRALAGGVRVVITPDGPRGPAKRFAPGVLIAAQRAGVPIVLAAASVDRQWRLRTWDRFIIPRPFARITVAYSEPIVVTAASARAAARAAPDFEARLLALEASARDG